MITFKSRATASVMMFDEVGKQMLDIMGKLWSPQGIITLEQLPDAIARLTRAAEEGRQRARGEPEEEPEDAPPTPRPIGLSQRAVPLIDMLNESLRAREPVIWG